MSLKVIAKTAQGGMFAFTTMHELNRTIQEWEANGIKINLKFVREPIAEDFEHTLILIYADLHNILKNQERLGKSEIIEEIKSSLNTIRQLQVRKSIFSE